MKSSYVPIIVLIGGLLIHFSAAVDYCDKKFCPDGNQNHIACKHSGEFATECQDPSLVVMTPELKRFILDLMNSLRNEIAAGDIEGYDAAERMPTFQWEDELSNMAELVVKRCKLQHDDCRNTEKYKYAGQSVAVLYHTKKTANSTLSIERLINSWFDEYLNANQSIVDKFPDDVAGTKFAHFTTLVNQKNDRTGCGAAQFKTKKNGKEYYALLLACNFGYTNFLGESVYKKGDACSKCATGCSTNYAALCTTKEVITSVPDDE